MNEQEHKPMNLFQRINQVRTKGKAMQDRHECIRCAEKRNVPRYGSKKPITTQARKGRKGIAL